MRRRCPPALVATAEQYRRPNHVRARRQRRAIPSANPRPRSPQTVNIRVAHPGTVRSSTCKTTWVTIVYGAKCESPRRRKWRRSGGDNIINNYHTRSTERRSPVRGEHWSVRSARLPPNRLKPEGRGGSHAAEGDLVEIRCPEVKHFAVVVPVSPIITSVQTVVVIGGRLPAVLKAQAGTANPPRTISK